MGAPHFHRVCCDLTDSCQADVVRVDQLEHFAAFAILGALFCFAYPRHIALVCLVVFGSALLLEFMQLLTPDRHGRIHDAIEKMAGGSAGLLAVERFFCPTKYVGGSRSNSVDIKLNQQA